MTNIQAVQSPGVMISLEEMSPLLVWFLMMVGKPGQVCCRGKGIEMGGQLVLYERNVLPPDSGVWLKDGNE